MKKKIALVVQRYGLEVNGGSELSCRLIAEKLKDYYDIEIITTKAVDYVTWENHYSEDVEKINGVTVRRFRTDFPRSQIEFSKINNKLFSNGNKSIYDELEWMKAQGPASFELLKYLETSHHQYDKIIFFTYLYFTTFLVFNKFRKRAFLFPQRMMNHIFICRCLSHYFICHKSFCS